MLTTETIEVGGRKLVLCEPTLRTDHIRAEMLKQAGAEQDGNELDNLARWIYPSLVACVLEGTPPTRDELVDLPVRELTAWREAAQRLNPDWFAGPADQVDGDVEEKKES